MERLGPYRLHRLIGEGAMGEVWFAKHELLDDARAIKILAFPMGEVDACAERFLEVAKMLAKLKHPNIAQLHDMAVADRVRYLVYEYVSPDDDTRCSLDDILQSNRFMPLPPAFVLDVVGQICKGLSYAHANGFVHRDLKPTNILVGANNHVKIADFSQTLILDKAYVRCAVAANNTPGALKPAPSLLLPQVEDAAPRELTSGAWASYVASYNFMAPEVLRSEEWSPQSDIYSVGLLAYLMLTGERPMGMAAPPSEIDEGIPEFWNDVVCRALQRRPELRQQSVDELWGQLRDYTDDDALKRIAAQTPAVVLQVTPNAPATQVLPRSFQADYETPIAVKATTPPQETAAEAPSVFALAEEADDPNVPGGRGLERNPYRLKTLGHLHWLRREVARLDTDSKYYVLECDIDASETSTGEFEPIGHTVSERKFAAFEGTLDGNGFAVRNLQMRRAKGNSVGLFGRVSDMAIIRNLTVADATIEGGEKVGALAGESYGRLENCHATGTVTGAKMVGLLIGAGDIGSVISDCTAQGIVTAQRSVGGLIGFTGTFCELNKCAATATVKGDENVGGLVGESFSPFNGCTAQVTVEGRAAVGGLVGLCGVFAAIKNSTASGSVSGTERVGGLIGENQSPVAQCSANCTVAGTHHIGGLVGLAAHGSELTEAHCTQPVSGEQFVGGLVGSNQGGIFQCTAAGAVTAQTHVGGLAGESNGPIADSAASGDVSGERIVGGMVGLAGTGNTIQSSRTEGAVTGVEAVGGLVGENAGRIVSSDAIGDVRAEKFAGGLCGVCNAEAYFENCTPKNRVTATEFVGGIAGTAVGTTLRECGYDGEIFGANYVGGLVGKLSGNSIVAQCTVVGAKIQAAGNCVGGIAGFAELTAFNECRVSAAVAGADYVGGLIGQGGESLELTQCTNVGNVSANEFVGGIAGIAGAKAKWKLCICTAESAVSGNVKVGGMVGENHGMMVECTSHATVAAHRMGGGMAGINAADGQIMRSASTGNVTCEDLCGCMIGQNIGQFSLCNAKGNVQGDKGAGGFVGYCSAESEGVSSYATGTVNGRSRVGGFAGEIHGTVSDCRADGAVTGSVCTGGFVGLLAPRAAVSESFQTGNVSGNENIGGFAGEHFGRLSDCYAEGTVNGKIAVGGLVGQVFAGADVTACHGANQTFGVTNVGVLVGTCEGTISDCAANGEAAGDENVGGVVGSLLQDGEMSRIRAKSRVAGRANVGGAIGTCCGCVEACLSQSTVQVTQCGGGFVGAMEESGAIRTSCARDVEVLGQDTIGAFVGLTNGSIADCYTLGGNVAGLRNVGGFCATQLAGKIERCYAATRTQGQAQTGGFSATRTRGHAAECFWDTQVSGQNRSADATGKPSLKLCQLATFTGWRLHWDFANVWTLQPDAPPTLRATPDPSVRLRK